MSIESSRLAQGIKYGITPTDCIDFISHAGVPKDAKCTYVNFEADHRPLKPEPDRIRCVVEGNKLDFWGDSSSPTTNLAEAKI